MNRDGPSVRCAVVAVTTVALVSVAGCSKESTDPQTTPATRAASTPSASASPTAEPSESPSEPAPSPSDSDAPLIPISRDIDLAHPPVWGIPANLGWEFVVQDVGGEHRLKNADGCTLSTLQRAGAIAPIPGSMPGVDDQAPTDQTATVHYLNLVVGDSQAGARDFAVSGPPTSFPLALGEARQQRVELAAVDFTYADAETGKRFHTVVAARLMTRPGGQLSVTMTCPESAYDAARPAVERLLVIPT